jgi:hypothetical protein
MAMLNASIAQLHGTTVGEMLADISNATGCPIEIRQEALQVHKTDLDMPIVLSLFNTSAHDALDTLEAEANAQGCSFSWTWWHGRVVVSTEDDIAKLPVIRVYDVADLQQSLWWPNPPEPRAPSSGSGLFGGLAGGADWYGPSQISNGLERLIVSTVNPEDWRDNGGAIGACDACDNQIVVLELQPQQEKVRQLLDDLRKAANQP